jgi:hypothetical protein
MKHCMEKYRNAVVVHCTAHRSSAHMRRRSHPPHWENFPYVASVPPMGRLPIDGKTSHRWENVPSMGRHPIYILDPTNIQACRSKLANVDVPFESPRATYCSKRCGCLTAVLKRCRCSLRLKHCSDSVHFFEADPCWCCHRALFGHTP